MKWWQRVGVGVIGLIALVLVVRGAVSFIPESTIEQWGEDVREEQAPREELSSPLSPLMRVQLKVLRDEVNLLRWQSHLDQMTILAYVRADLRGVNLVEVEELWEACLHLRIWKTDLEDAQQSVVEYRQAEPTMVAKNESVHILESETERWLGAIEELADECRRAGFTDGLN